MRHTAQRGFTLALAVLLTPALALAAGTEIPENGAAIAGRGGTSIGMLDTAYSLIFNPAGMTRVNGLDIRLDARMVHSGVKFTREEAHGHTFKTVENSAGIMPVPLLAAVYRAPVEGLLGRFSFGLGFWAAPGVMTYEYPDARNARGYDPQDNFADEAGQRYAMISSENIILYPSIGLAYRIWDTLSVGVTFQSVYANLTTTQAMGTADSTFEGKGQEFTQYDTIATLKFEDAFTPSAIFGLAYDPIPGLSLGVSFRPKIDIRAAGPLEIELPESISDMAQVVSEDPRASLAITFPAMLRAGAAYRWRGLRVGGEFVYEHWSSNKRFLVTPDVELDMQVPGEEGGPEKLAPITLPKHWKDTYSGRLGVSYEIFPVESKKFSLEVFGGGLYESNAIPSKYQSIDFVTGERIGGSLGLTAGWDRIGLTASFLGYLPVDFTVTDSELRRSVADTALAEDFVVGNGRYQADTWMFSVGLIYRDFNLGG